MSSTTPKVAIDFDSPVPLHEQVAAAIRRAIADGEAKPGERLPPARDLAAVLRGQLQHRVPVLAHSQGRGPVGVFPRARRDGHRRRPQRGVVVAQARELVKLARKLGYRPDELVAIIEEKVS